MADKKLNPVQIIIGVVFTALGLAYLFLGLDIVPDNLMPVVGYLDDAVVMVLLWMLFRRFRKKIK